MKAIKVTLEGDCVERRIEGHWRFSKADHSDLRFSFNHVSSDISMEKLALFSNRKDLDKERNVVDVETEADTEVHTEDTQLKSQVQTTADTKSGIVEVGENSVPFSSTLVPAAQSQDSQCFQSPQHINHHDLLGYYEGHFEISSADGVKNLVESMYLVASSLSSLEEVVVKHNPDLKNTLPQLPLEQDSWLQAIQATAVELPSISTLFGYGENSLGSFTMVMIVDDKSGKVFCEKSYIPPKLVLRRVRTEKPKRDIGAVNETQMLSIVDRKRRRSETPKARNAVKGHDNNRDDVFSCEKVHTYQLSTCMESDDEQSYVEGYFDEQAFEIYEGGFLYKQKHGFGISLRADGTMYEGNWVYNKEHGHGKLMNGERKIIYCGDFSEGEFNGHGEYFFDNGDRYTGEWKEGLRHGKGEYVCQDGSTYVGDWKENRRHGKGIFFWSDQSFYDGEWENDQRHGRGILELQGSFKYDGSWSHNFPEGRGSGTFADGQEYQGTYKQGCREGRGSIAFPGGAVYEGRFRDDKIDGMGTIKLSSIMPGYEENEIYIPIQVQADIKRIHLRAGFGDDKHM